MPGLELGLVYITLMIRITNIYTVIPFSHAKSRSRYILTFSLAQARSRFPSVIGVAIQAQILNMNMHTANVQVLYDAEF